jgi:hypothetical protein
MVHRVLIICSVTCSFIVFASFTFFAVDQMSGASQKQAAETAGTPIPKKSGKPDSQQPRKFVDGAARALTYPFHSLLHSGSDWAEQLFLLVCGLALYGLGLGYLARYASGIPLRQ